MKHSSAVVLSVVNSSAKVISSVCVIGLMVSACGAPKNNGARSKLDIVGGETVPETQNDVRRTSTVALTTDAIGKDPTQPPAIDRGKSFCTATIIAKNALVTAAHCIQKFDAQTRTKLETTTLPNVNNFIAFFGTQVSRDGTWIRAKRVVAHPDWKPGLTLQPSPGSAPNDIGVIILSENIPEGYEAAKIAPLDLKIKSGSVYLAGFGVTQGRGNNDTGILREVQTDIVNVDDKAQRITVGSWGHGACAGDSGGPAYVKDGEEWYVTGATSTGPEIFGKCIGIGNNYTDIRYYADWIAEEIAK